MEGESRKKKQKQKYDKNWLRKASLNDLKLFQVFIFTIQVGYLSL